MTLSPSIQEQISRARTDLRMGVPVVLDKGETALIIPAETLSDERLKDLRQMIGEMLLVLSAKRARTLKLAAYDGDLARVFVPLQANTGWVRAMADPSSDLQTPLKGPFESKRNGDTVLERFALNLVKSAHLLPTALIKYISQPNATNLKGLTRLNVTAASPYLSAAAILSGITSAKLPISATPKGKLHVFRPDNGAEEHYAMEINKPERRKPVLVRLHSACFTGDVLGSLKCDCGAQLHGALQLMGQNDGGVLLYLNQEGRGIGMANKMRAYSLQDEGFDTVEANHRLGFEDDERDFRIGASILKDMRIRDIRLMTNNPTKILMMERNGINVHERVPLILGENSTNAHYLSTKARKSGHLL